MCCHPMPTPSEDKKTNSSAVCTFDLHYELTLNMRSRCPSSKSQGGYAGGTSKEYSELLNCWYAPLNCTRLSELRIAAACTAHSFLSSSNARFTHLVLLTIEIFVPCPKYSWQLRIRNKSYLIEYVFIALPPWQLRGIESIQQGQALRSGEVIIS